MTPAFFWPIKLPYGNILLIITLCSLPIASHADREIMVNLFRSPSMGLEFRESFFGVHVGFYPTIISKNAQGENETTWFIKLGVTAYVGRFSLGGEQPSSFFVSASYVRGLNHDWENGFLAEAGFRYVAWRGLNLRLGGCALLSPGQRPRVNPTPGIGWSIPIDEPSTISKE